MEAVNMVLMAVGFVSVYPLAKSFFPEPPRPKVHAIRIGLGSFNDSVHVEALNPELAGQDPGGWIPEVSLYNSNGEMIGYDAGIDDFRPPCFWMSTNPKLNVPYAVSWKLSDFAPKGSEKAKGIGQQWIDDKPTLCEAPGRIQFWRYSRPDTCVPYYQKDLLHAPNGTDLDREYVKHGHIQRCDDAGTPDNGAKLYNHEGVELPPVEPPPDPHPPGSEPTSEIQKEDREAGKQTIKDTGLKGITKRDDGQKFFRTGDGSLEMCDHQVVISEYSGHSAIEVCNSPFSVGPDFVALTEGHAGIYCDMCEHRWYHVCSRRYQTQCWDLRTRKLRLALRWKREEGVLYPEDKVYKKVMRWK